MEDLDRIIAFVEDDLTCYVAGSRPEEHVIVRYNELPIGSNSVCPVLDVSCRDVKIFPSQCYDVIRSSSVGDR